VGAVHVTPTDGRPGVKVATTVVGGSRVAVVAEPVPSPELVQ
jgi:hypothetical protein